MFRNFIRAAVLSAVSLVASMPAAAATLNITGGITEIEVTADLGALGLAPSVFGSAGLNGSTLSFPITGGSVNMAGDALIEHDGGGVVLTNGSQSAIVGNFLIDTAAATVFGNVNGGTAFAPLFQFGTIDANGIELEFTSTLAGALTAVFGAPDLTNATFGVANASPELAPVPLPAAGWLLLVGFGGLFALRRRSGVQA